MFRILSFTAWFCIKILRKEQSFRIFTLKKIGVESDMKVASHLGIWGGKIAWTYQFKTSIKGKKKNQDSVSKEKKNQDSLGIYP